LQRPVSSRLTGHNRLRCPRTGHRPRSGQDDLGGELRPGNLCAAPGRLQLGAAAARDRFRRALHLLGLRARLRVRACGGDLVRHGLARSRAGGRTWSEVPAPARVRALAPDSGDIVWVGTERGLYRLGHDPSPQRGEGEAEDVAWLDKRGRPACAVAPVVKGCRVDMPPIEALELVAPGRVYAATRQGVYEQDGDALNLCNPVPAATAFLSLAPGWYAVGRQAGLAS